MNFNAKGSLIKIIIFFYPLAISCNPNIVFIHIGKKIPSYTTTAIKQARIFNKKAPIYLLGNKKALTVIKNKLKDIKFVNLEDLKASQEHVFFKKHNKLDKTFRNGFWLYATERCFYLDEFVREYKLNNVFHLENDVMLYRDLNELLPIFEQCYPEIAATFDHDERIILGFSYFQKSNSIRPLIKYLKNNPSNINEMKTIAKFAKKYTKIIGCLPIIFPEYTQKRPLINLKNEKPKNPQNYWNNFHLFQSIFDAAALGQYLGGIDPRNSNKQNNKRFINETAIFNPSLLNFVWVKDDEGRNVPYINYNNRLIRINNLHIHSKALSLFES